MSLSTCLTLFKFDTIYLIFRNSLIISPYLGEVFIIISRFNIRFIQLLLAVKAVEN